MKKQNKAILAGFMSVAMAAAGSFTAFAAQPAPAADSLEASSIADMQVSEFGNNNGDSTRDEHDTGHIYAGVAITDGQVDEANSNWADRAAEEDGIFSVSLNDDVEGEGFTAVRAFGEETVNVTGNLYIHDDGDGTYDSDFTGMGSAVTAANRSTVYVNDMNFLGDGVVRSFGNVADSTMIVENSSLTSLGANPFTDFYSDYVNTYNTATMISPPWVLGFQGSARTINIINSGTSTNVIVADSDVYTGGWASLSTDGMGGTARYYVYGSTLGAVPESEGGNNSGWEILGYDEDAYGSAYALLTIGGTTVANLYGTDVDGSTFAGMSMGGNMFYQGLNAGEIYEASDGVSGEVLYTYTAQEDTPSVINSVFGITVQGAGEVGFLDGCVVNTEAATFVYRDGNVDYRLSGTAVNPKNGIILQMMDNDNSNVGDGPIGQSFDKYFYEEAGFPSEAYETDASYVRTTDGDIDPAKTYYAEAGNNEYVEVENPVQEGLVAYYEKTTPGSFVTLSLANGEYNGDIYNATGYYGQASDNLEVTIADDAVLGGDIALTTHVHGIMLNGRNVDDVIAAIESADSRHDEITEGFYSDLDDIKYVFIDSEGNVTDNKDEADAVQFTQFTSVEYYLIMQVINKVLYNGDASINVIVNGTWKPQSESLITYLEIAEGAHVYGDLTVLDDDSILITPSDNEIEAGTYGGRFVYVEDPNGSSGGESSGAEAAEDAESAGGESDGAEAAQSDAGESDGAQAAQSDAGESADAQAADGESPAGESDAAQAPQE